MDNLRLYPVHSPPDFATLIEKLERESENLVEWFTRNHMKANPDIFRPGAVARSGASPLGMQAAPSSIPTSGTFFRGDLVMKTFLRPFSLFR